MTIPEDISALLKQVCKATPLPPGASKADIIGLSNTIDQPLPKLLEDWLSYANGPNVGRGGTYGIKGRGVPHDIASVMAWHPVWADAGWIPIAGDGCGNQYILLTTSVSSGMHPVCFVDNSQDDEALAYCVASSLWSFLRFYLNAELGDYSWPEERDSVLARDPDLAQVRDAPFPWDLLNQRAQS